MSAEVDAITALRINAARLMSIIRQQREELASIDALRAEVNALRDINDKLMSEIRAFNEQAGDL